MKKSIICLLGLSVMALSCTREENPVQQNDKYTTDISIVAKIADVDMADVKTAYDETYANPKFSWRNEDMIAIQLEERENPGKYNQHMFITAGGDAYATFNAYSDLNVTTYKLSTYAFYPRHASNENGRDLIYDHTTYQDLFINPVATLPKTDLQAIVPLLGIKDSGTADNVTSGVLYNFKTLTGVIRVSLKNVPATAKKVKVSASSKTYYLSGYVRLSKVTDGEISYNDFWYGGNNSRTFVFDFTPTEGEDLIVYIPVPTGTLTGGFTVEVLGDQGAEIISRTISDDIVIERNHIYYVPDIIFDNGWRSIGTGWFGDNYLFAQSSFDKKGRMIPVDIQQNKSNSNKYRIRDPYGTAAKKLAVSLAGFHNAYLTFTIDGESVSFEDHKTGIRYGDKNTMITKHVGGANDKVRYDSSNPVLVSFSPDYKMETSSGSKTYTSNLSTSRYSLTSIINVVFPGYGVSEIFAGEWKIANSNNTITMSAIDNGGKNVRITHYHYETGSPALDVDGVCDGVYYPETGILTFTKEQVFASTGTEGEYYTFLGTPSSEKQDLSFNPIDNNGQMKTQTNYFCFSKYDGDGWKEWFHTYSGNPILVKK